MENDVSTWFNSWERLWSVGQGTVFFFVFIVVLIRISGKRTTSQMNNFDWIVLVAIGSLASSGILLENVSIADAGFAIVLLAFLQWLTTWLVIRSDRFANLIKPSPRMLTHKGKLLEGPMRKERISRHEIEAVLRGQGFTALSDANWVILESDGSMTVIPKQDADLSDVDLMRSVLTEKA